MNTFGQEIQLYFTMIDKGKGLKLSIHMSVKDTSFAFKVVS